MNITSALYQPCFQVLKLSRTNIIVPSVGKLLLPLAASHQSQPCRGIKDQIKQRGIDWIPPTKHNFYHPEKTCDLKPFDAPDKTRPHLSMRHAMEEYDDAPVIVQQLLSVEFAPRHHMLAVAKYDVLRRVQRHQYDTGSLQSQVGKFTVFIRYMQLEENQFYLKRHPIYRVNLKFAIDKRRKYLRVIKSVDYKLYEWLLEELDIIYKPRTLTPGRIYRYDSLRKLVGLHCENLRKIKMEAFQKSLDERRPAFLKKKYETLEWIKKTEEKFGLPTTVDVENGVISPKVEKPQTVWDRIFGPFIDDPPLRDFDWQYPEGWKEEYKAICEEGAKSGQDSELVNNETKNEAS